MTRSTLTLALCVFLAMALPGSAVIAGDAVGAQADTTAKKLSDAYNRFGFSLFDQISGTDFGENIFISPASAAFALAMLYNGAAGTTQEELSGVLEFGGLTREEVNNANASLLASLNTGDSKVELAVANSIWFRNTFRFRQDFLDRANEFYSAEVAALNFADPGAVSTINDWVKANTREKIASIIDRIDPLDVMFLINAVYFKGMWTHPFHKERTSDQTFHLLGERTVEVPMMRQTEKFGYLQTETFQAVRLPYGGGSFSMLLFLPAADYGLERFVGDVNSENWDAWKDRFGALDVNLVMPRFKLEYNRSFNDPLVALGMRSAFDQGAADLTGMWDPSKQPGPNLYVSFVRQKTYLDVNEEGTEAAAVTGIGVTVASMPPPPVEMVIDRPFFCAIVDDQTDLVLFMGAIVDPS